VPRLRQAVLAAADLDAVTGELRRELGLGEPFHDEGVGLFGLRNSVFALGDAFIEVVSPAQEGTAAGRHLERHGGDSGYMIMFQVEDIAAARQRAQQAGIRTAWEIAHDDIEDIHLHPADTRGAILALDEPRPPESWRWGGPGWNERAAEGRLQGVTIAVHEPRRVARLWAVLLGAEQPQATHVPLDAQTGIDFVESESDPEPGLTEVTVALPEEVRRGRDSVTIAGVRFRFA
jgi:predicted enzyme related to lactoylglutathione lyase